MDKIVTRETLQRISSRWVSHLAGMIATSWANGHSDALILEIDRQTVTLLSRSGGTTTRDAQSSADDAGIQHLARLVMGRSDRRRLLLLRVPPERVLRKTLSVPIAARHNLQEILGFEIERETPFGRDEVYWSYGVRQKDSARGLIEIDLFLVPRNSIEPLVEIIRAAGLDPAGIDVDTGTNATALIPLHPQNSQQRARSRRALAPLVASGAVLAVMAIAIPFIRQQWALSSVDAMITTLTEPAREASILRQSADQLTKTVAALKGEYERNGSAVMTLAAITKSLPDETYLTALNLRDGRLTMSGLSRSAAQLIGLLAETPGFREPAFASPVVENEGKGLEAFTITVNIAAETGS
jgi:general secretion pathway protein L